VQAEDTDALILLMRHSSSTNHPLFFTTSKGSYDVRGILKSLSERQRCYLLFCYAFTGCGILFLPLPAMGKPFYLIRRLCAGDVDELMDIFLDAQASGDVVIRSGNLNFQPIYVPLPGTALHVLMKASSSADQTANSTSNRGCSCTAFSHTD